MNYSAQRSPAKAKIPEAETERFQALVFGLYQCCQNRMAKQSRQFDLPDAELRCLRLFGQESSLTPKEIANQMGVVKSRITKIIDGLVEKNLILRAKDPEDSRSWRLSLTPQGTEKLAMINQSLTVSNERILANMSTEQRRDLLIHLEALRASMEAAG
jgi:DNA-binding MarR family transcriptional regulator